MVESINIDTMATSLAPTEEEDDDSLGIFTSGDLLKHTVLFPSGTNGALLQCTVVLNYKRYQQKLVCLVL